MIVINDHWNSKRAKVAEKALEATASILGIPTNDLIVSLVEEDDVYRGLADYDPEEYQFYIWLHKMTKRVDIIKTAIHEMVHIKQFMLDGLDVESRSFKGEVHPEDEFPKWEIEAYEAEEELYIEVLSKLKQAGRTKAGWAD